MRSVSAADANREFSKILRTVREGETITVTSHGEPVAVISPIGELHRSGYDSAKSTLLTRLQAQAPAGVVWTRDDIYDV